MAKRKFCERRRTMKVSQKRYEQQRAFDKRATRRYGVKLNRNTDADLIARLEKEPSMQGFIKKCMREYIANEEK